MRSSWLKAVALSVLAATPVLAQDSGGEGGEFLWALEDRDAKEIVERGTKRFARSPFTRLVLRPSTSYRLWLLRRSDFAIGSAQFTIPPLGPTSARPRFEIPEIALQAQPPYDSDQDGLSDAAERVAGSRADLADTDSDGEPDALEVRNGTNVNDGLVTGRGLTTVLGTLPEGSKEIRVRDDLALLANRQTGQLHVFNVFLALPPREIARVTIPNVDLVGVTTSRNRALLAGGTGGLSIVTLGEGPAARVERQVLFPGWTSTSVVAADSLAFVSNTRRGGSELAVVDVLTGATLRRVPVAALGLRSLRLYEDLICGLSDTSLLVFQLSATPTLLGEAPFGFDQSTFLGTVGLAVANGQAFVGNGLVLNASTITCLPERNDRTAMRRKS